MNVGGIQGIESRIASIESRFGRTAATSGMLGVDLMADTDVSVESTEFADVLAGATTDLLDGVVPTRGGVAVDGSIVTRAAAAHSTTAHSTPAHSTTAAEGGGDLAGPVAAGTPFSDEFEAAGAAYGVPPRLLAAVGWVESRYTVDAVSPDGALGVMQIMPMTAHELGVDPTDPDQAIDGAARLLADHHRRFGSWDLALAAYHSGAGGVSRNGYTPPPRAAVYVDLVNERLERT